MTEDSPLFTPADSSLPVNRRHFLHQASLLSGSALIAANSHRASADSHAPKKPETLVSQLYDSLSQHQRAKICFDWNHEDERGLLRTYVSNNWNITDVRTTNVGSSFFTADQRDMIEAIFYGLYQPEWRDRIRRQLQDDAGGYGRAQTIAIFGEPETGKFEFVMTGRHLTIRCDGDTAEHVALGGPIFYGHASTGSPNPFYELPHHPENVFWPQATEANKLYEMLDGRQRRQALLKSSPYEHEVEFPGSDKMSPGLLISELFADQKDQIRKVLNSLLEPFRISDQEEVRHCLQVQGGLDKCSISFYEDEDLGNDGVWDNWRIEGPSFVWYYRGAPHVHVWANVASDASVLLNSAG